MIKADSPETVSSLIRKHFGRGMVTNCFLTGDQIKTETENGSLYYIDSESSLLLFKMRDGYQIMYFYMNSEEPVLPEIPHGTVCEIAYRDKDQPLINTSLFLQNNGFTKLFSRDRLLLPALGKYEADTTVSFAKPDEFDTVKSILYSCFDKRTGCLPSDGDIISDIEANNIFVKRNEEGKPVGLIHISVQKAFSEIRHLAINEEYRGKGLSSSLLGSFLKCAEGRIRVWVRNDNVPAVKAYMKFGFINDSMKSDVIYFE